MSEEDEQLASFYALRRAIPLPAPDLGEVLTKRLEQVSTIVRSLWIVGGIVVIVTVWVIKVQTTLSAQDVILTTHETKLAALDKSLDADRAADALVHQTQLTMIAANAAELDKRKEAIAQVAKMWALYENGISFPEAYARRNGYKPAP